MTEDISLRSLMIVVSSFVCEFFIPTSVILEALKP